MYCSVIRYMCHGKYVLNDFLRWCMDINFLLCCSLLCVYRLWKFVWFVPLFKERGRGCVVVWCRVRTVVPIWSCTSMYVSVHYALLNVNHMFSIQLPAALPALPTNTRIVQSASCNVTCPNLHGPSCWGALAQWHPLVSWHAILPYQYFCDRWQ
jgi:hypothetical protein